MTERFALRWDRDDEHCAYNSTYGYHAANIGGLIILRSPIHGSSRHESMSEAKEYAALDAFARYLKETTHDR